MLTEVCNFIHNYFEIARQTGEFKVENGTIDLSDLLYYGQRFRIVGSHLNDGIYTYRENEIYNDDNTEAVTLYDETFAGAVYAMSVPRDVWQLIFDIKDWVNKNKTVLDSPYTSESFGGYSYTKASGSGANAGGVLGWQDVFRSRLNAYRKIS